MGQSTNAILFFGYCWDEEHAIDDDLRRAAGVGEDSDVPEWPTIIADKRGLQNPWDGYSDDPADSYAESRARGDAWVSENRQQIDDYREALKSIEGEYGGVSLASHCSGECPMPMLVTWSMTAHRGGPKQAAMPCPRQSWIDNLNKWLSDFEIEPPQDGPRFWLVSDWT